MATYNQFKMPGYAPGQTSQDIYGAAAFNPAVPLGVPPAGITPSLLAGATANIQSGLNGELPEDVRNLIETRSAELGVASGMPGSENARYRGLRDLGLTSLQRKDQATNQLLPFFMTPMQQQQIALQQQEMALRNQQASRSSNPAQGGSWLPTENRPPMAAQPHANVPAAQNSYQAAIGNIMKKYLGGDSGAVTGSGVMASKFLSPMSGAGRNDDAWMSGLAELGLLPDNEMAAYGGSGGYTGGSGSSSSGSGYAAPGFYSGSGNPTTAQLADMGIVDPLFSQPATSYTGDVNYSDYYDDLASGYGGSYDEWSDYG